MSKKASSASVQIGKTIGSVRPVTFATLPGTTWNAVAQEWIRPTGDGMPKGFNANVATDKTIGGAQTVTFAIL